MSNIFDIINVPLGLLISVLYNICNNYALTLFLFAVVVIIVLLPLGIQQQKSQIKMARIRPKEQAIRKKYAGRTDTVTQQKMQSEIMDMYKTENYSMMSGCLPMLIQLPIIWAMYSIVRNPLTYISRFSVDLLTQIKEVIFTFKDNANFADMADIFSKVKEAKNLTEIDIVRVFSQHLDSIKSAVESSGLASGDIDKFSNYVNIDFGFLGQSLTSTPAQMGISILLLIPLLNFVGQFIQARLTRMINSKTALGDMSNNNTMKMMEYITPLFMVYIAYTMNAAVGLYYVYQSVLRIGQILILAKVYPLPQISDEDYKLAEQQYGTSAKKKKKKSADSELSDSEIIETELLDSPKNKDDDNGEDSQDGENGEDKKYISNTIPQGVNPQVKSNYQKTGKKYSIKRRNKNK